MVSGKRAAILQIIQIWRKYVILEKVNNLKWTGETIVAYINFKREWFIQCLIENH